MDAVARMACGLWDWARSRPRPDIEGSATWFLLLFAYAHGLTQDGLGAGWSGLTPDITLPQACMVVMIGVCLLASVVTFLEPWLPRKVGMWTRRVRCSILAFAIRRCSVVLAFIIGLSAGYRLLRDDAQIPWLTFAVALMGVVIVVLLLADLFLRRPPDRAAAGRD